MFCEIYLEEETQPVPVTELFVLQSEIECTTAYKTYAAVHWLRTYAHMLSFPLILLTSI